jgi:hypothetical protein
MLTICLFGTIIASHSLMLRSKFTVVIGIPGSNLVASSTWKIASDSVTSSIQTQTPFG